MAFHYEAVRFELSVTLRGLCTVRASCALEVHVHTDIFKPNVTFMVILLFGDHVGVGILRPTNLQLFTTLVACILGKGQHHRMQSQNELLKLPELLANQCEICPP